MALCRVLSDGNCLVLFGRYEVEAEFSHTQFGPGSDFGLDLSVNYLGLTRTHWDLPQSSVSEEVRKCCSTELKLLEKLTNQ